MRPPNFQAHLEVVRSTFLNYRNELGWGIPGDVVFVGTVMPDAPFLTFRYFFKRLSGEEYSSTMGLDASKYIHKKKVKATVPKLLLQQRAMDLAKHCILMRMLFYAKDHGFDVSIAQERTAL